MKEQIELKDFKAWPKRIEDKTKGGMPKLTAVTCRLNGNGDLLPINEPVMVKKETFSVNITSTNATPIVTMADFIGPDAALHKNYMVTIEGVMSSAIAAAADDIRFAWGTGGIIAHLNDWATLANTRGGLPYPIKLFPMATITTVLNLVAPDWTTGTEIYHITLMLWRLPDNICFE